MENVDLHCHSRASDGMLAPAELAVRARDRGVTTLALTDHDETGGLEEAAVAARDLGLRFIPGVEISVTWNDFSIHVLGLGIRHGDARLAQGLQAVRADRPRRAAAMAAALEKRGIPGSLEGALAHAGNPEFVGRAHFARFLVEKGYARDLKGVFRNYLVSGKPGYVPHRWAALADAVGWIKGAGGIAVVAHPGRYRFSRKVARRFLGEFADSGGLGIEVVTASHSQDQCAEFAALAREFGMLASRGSDFHAPGESRAELGGMPPLPEGLKPVWQQL